MSVDTKHPLYEDNEVTWKFLRDSVEGSRAIKNGGTLYVPKLSGQDNTEYAAMVNRPSYENYTQRTLDGLTGLIFSKEPTHTAPKPLEDLFDNIDGEGKTLTDLAQETVEENMTVGRVGLLVDAPSVDVTGMTLAEAEALNLRPAIKMYTTESIINWRHETINNQKVLSMVVLMESKDVWTEMFINTPEIFYRVLHLENGVYTQTIFEEVKQGTNVSYVQTGETYQPKMKGNTLSYIPFVPITPTALEIDPAKAPIYDVADVNLTHFKVNVDFYHGMHRVSFPTTWGAGIQKKQGDNDFKIGGDVIHLFPDPKAKLDILEFKGDGLGTLEREKGSLKETIVVLGTNMLQGDKNVAEAENTVAMRSSGERATLISIADTTSRGITKALEIMAEWLGASGKVIYNLNTDYNLTQISAQLLKEIIVGKTLGAVPLKVLYDNLVKGELIDSKEISFEQYKEMIANDIIIPEVSPLPPKANNDNTDIKAIANKIGATNV